MFVNLSPSLESAQVGRLGGAAWCLRSTNLPVLACFSYPLAAWQGFGLSGQRRTNTLVCLALQESLCSLRFAAKVNACEIGTAKRQVTTAR